MSDEQGDGKALILQPLNEQEAKFVAAYIETFHVEKAARAAGYPERTAMAHGTRLLRRAHIQAALVEWRSSLLEKYGVTADRVIRELAILGFSNMDDYTTLMPDGQTRELDFGKSTRDMMAAVSEITVEEEVDEDGSTIAVRKTKFKLHNKLGALQMLATHLGVLKPGLPGDGKGGSSEGETHLHVHMHGLEAPRPGEDRSYRVGYGKPQPLIEHEDAEERTEAPKT